MIQPTHRSFTLLELLLVMVVVGVFASLSLPQLSGSLRHQRLQDQVRATIALSRKARALATSEGRSYVLVIDGEKRELRLLRRRDPLAEAGREEPELEEAADPAPDWAQPWAFGEGVTLKSVEREDKEEESERIEITFSPNGEAESVRLTYGLGELDEEVAILEVTKALGEVRLLAEDPAEDPAGKS